MALIGYKSKCDWSYDAEERVRLNLPVIHGPIIGLFPKHKRAGKSAVFPGHSQLFCLDSQLFLFGYSGGEMFHRASFPGVFNATDGLNS